MNELYNEYNHVEDNKLYTWLDETRDFRKHQHDHLKEETEKIMENIDNTRKQVMENVDETRKQVLDRVEEAENKLEAKLTTINTYVVNIDRKIDTIDANVDDIKQNMATRVLNAVKQFLRLN